MESDGGRRGSIFLALTTLDIKNKSQSPQEGITFHTTNVQDGEYIRRVRHMFPNVPVVEIDWSRPGQPMPPEVIE